MLQKMVSLEERRMKQMTIDEKMLKEQLVTITEETLKRVLQKMVSLEERRMKQMTIDEKMLKEQLVTITEE
ncbi:hypothetical protein CEF12_17010, partial [Enterococcus faecalis]